MMNEGQCNILLVDDDQENLLALESVLAGLEQNLIKANSCSEALRYLLEQDFAVILLDVKMPGTDGFETAALIRERERSKHVPIIFLTAIGTSEPEMIRGYSIGAVDYLFKPFIPEVLKSKVAVFVDLFHMGERVRQQARQTEEALRQADKLASLGTLVSGMAHEVTNPAQGIMAMAENILGEKDHDKIQEYARDIVTYSQHIGTVVRDFCRYARPASQDEEVMVDLNERLAEAVKMVRHGSAFGAVEILEHFPSVSRVVARRSEIDQVFVNLIANAVQAMERHGCLTLGTKQEGEAIRVSIGDTGCGIPRELVPRIFDPFFTTKEPGKGTGLGLSIVYQIVTKYEGTIHVESEPGHGTRFIIHWPIRRRSIAKGGGNDEQAVTER